VTPISEVHIEAMRDARADLHEWRMGIISLLQLRADPPAESHGENAKLYVDAYKRARDAVLKKWFRRPIQRRAAS